MTSVVIDASVAIKWLPLFGTEPYALDAQAFLEASRRREIDLLVPDLFWPEISSVLCKAVRKQACNAVEAEAALLTLESQELMTVPSLGLLKFALDIALRYGRSTYDSVYVALALSAKCDLITADERLVNALAGRLPVRWLAGI